MALSQAAFKAEQALGHGDNATTAQDVTNPALDREKYGDPSGEKMQALIWNGKNKVEMSMMCWNRQYGRLLTCTQWNVPNPKCSNRGM